MVPIGSGAQREVPDVRLSRYAYYLIVENGAPSKSVIANGQAPPTPDSYTPKEPITPSITQLQPSLIQPLHTHRLRRAQLLREKAHTQLFQ